MIVTENDIASGRYLLLPLSVDKEQLHAWIAGEEAHRRLTGQLPSRWTLCIGGDTERGVMISLQGTYIGKGIRLETDGGPEGNPLTSESTAIFRVVDAATSQELARTDPGLRCDMEDFR